MILSRDQYFERVHNIVGDDSTDESISLLEDLTDTYNDLENRANADSENWEQKYNELNEQWKKRYKSRFFNGDGGTPNKSETVTVDETDITYNDLFK